MWGCRDRGGRDVVCYSHVGRKVASGIAGRRWTSRGWSLGQRSSACRDELQQEELYQSTQSAHWRTFGESVELYMRMCHARISTIPRQTPYVEHTPCIQYNLFQSAKPTSRGSTSPSRFAGARLVELFVVLFGTLESSGAAACIGAN